MPYTYRQRFWPFTGFLPAVMQIPSYKTSSAILIEEYYVFSKLKYQASCTLTSIQSSTSMNKCISHVGHHILLTGVLTPAAKGAKPIKCPDYISETMQTVSCTILSPGGF